MKKKHFFLLGIGAALATVASIFLIKKKKISAGEEPPKKAPQLDIINPGEQSEFPTSPSESEIG